VGVWIFDAPMKIMLMVYALVSKFLLGWKFRFLTKMLGWTVGEYDEEIRGL
jgi:hypothetical protein